MCEVEIGGRVPPVVGIGKKYAVKHVFCFGVYSYLWGVSHKVHALKLVYEGFIRAWI